MEDDDEKEHDKSCALSSSPSSSSLSSDPKIVQPAETTGVDVDVRDVEACADGPTAQELLAAIMKCRQRMTYFLSQRKDPKAPGRLNGWNTVQRKAI